MAFEETMSEYARLSAGSVPSQSFDTLFAAGTDLGLQSLAGHKALITGASSGIGKATACALASCGVNLVLVARRKERLVDIADEISRRELGVDVSIVVGDVSGDEPLYCELERLTIAQDAPDIVIANAGGALGKALVGEEELADAAVHAFAKALRYETYGTGVRVTIVAPGFVGEGTEFAVVRNKGDGVKALATYAGFDELRASDIACQLVWALRQPQRVNVDLLHVMPSNQGGATRIKRVEE